MKRGEFLQKIYVVEDDESIRETVVYALKSAGFNAIGFERGDEFFVELEKNPQKPVLVLLDIMLPGDDGLTILKILRSTPQNKTLPVIMLTAKGSELDKVKGLDLGADDYISKPFGVMELISRVNALLRRIGSELEPNEQLEYGGITIYNARRAVRVDSKFISLTYKEYELLLYFMRHKERVIDREKIMEAVWGYNFEGESRTLDAHIRSLRQKLGAAGEYIKTIRNVGYKLGE